MTRKLATITAVVFALSLAALAQAPAAASKIGIIDLQGAIVSTNEGQRDFKALQTKFEPKRTDLQNASAEIEKLKTQLQQQEKLMNDESRAKLVKDIEAKQKTLQRNAEDAQNDFGGQQNEIAQRIGTKIYALATKYAGENGYAVVLNVSATDQPIVLFAAPTTDITKAVVELYNTQSGVPAQAQSAAKPAAAPKPAAPAARKK